MTESLWMINYREVLSTVRIFWKKSITQNERVKRYISSHINMTADVIPLCVWLTQSTHVECLSAPVLGYNMCIEGCSMCSRIRIVWFNWFWIWFVVDVFICMWCIFTKIEVDHLMIPSLFELVCLHRLLINTRIEYCNSMAEFLLACFCPFHGWCYTNMFVYGCVFTDGYLREGR